MSLNAIWNWWLFPYVINVYSYLETLGQAHGNYKLVFPYRLQRTTVVQIAWRTDYSDFSDLFWEQWWTINPWRGQLSTMGRKIHGLAKPPLSGLILSFPHLVHFVPFCACLYLFSWYTKLPFSVNIEPVFKDFEKDEMMVGLFLQAAIPRQSPFYFPWGLSVSLQCVMLIKWPYWVDINFMSYSSWKLRKITTFKHTLKGSGHSLLMRIQ